MIEFNWNIKDQRKGVESPRPAGSGLPAFYCPDCRAVGVRDDGVFSGDPAIIAEFKGKIPPNVCHECWIKKGRFIPLKME